MDAVASGEERAAVDELLGPPDSGWAGADRDDETFRVARSGREARDRRHLLLPILHALQARVGWISPGGLNYVSERLTVPPAEAYGVATFYAMFSVEQRPTHVVHVCDDLACRVQGGLAVCDRLEESLGPAGTSQQGGPYTWVRSPCLGMCELAPVMLLQQTEADDLQVVSIAPDDVARDAGHLVVKSRYLRDVPAERSTPKTSSAREPRLLRRVGVVDPASIDDFRAHGGFEALRLALEHGPEWTIQQVTDSKLLGRGGAAFPTGVKWKAVAEQPVHPHYFICNADESEPGTFKDRVVMEQDPFAVVESLAIAGITTGCQQGYIYVRGEYPLAAGRLQHAIDESGRHGFLGGDVMGHGTRFDIELRRGAGAYICGEETALFNSLEGKRGEPRNKPPFPVQRGLFGKPTGINNVETLINVTEILRIGGEAFARIGTEGSTGPRLLCLSGHVTAPGVYEVEHGVTLRDAIALAGGMRGGGDPMAVLLGGAAGGFVGPDRLDIRLTFEDAREGGYTLGSGVVMAFDDSVDLGDLALRIARFFRDESCGQCVPCRVGTVRQEEALHRIASGRTLGSRQDEEQLLGDVAKVMRDASICGLGQTAANAVQSLFASFTPFANGSGEGS
jgi:NADH-quinone oxidoreductase subunit F